MQTETNSRLPLPWVEMSFSSQDRSGFIHLTFYIVVRPGNRRKWAISVVFCSVICLFSFMAPLLPSLLIEPMLSFIHLLLIFLRRAHKMESTESCQNMLRSGRPSPEVSPPRLRSGWAHPRSRYEVFWQKKIGWCLTQLPPHFMLFSTVWQFIYSIYLVLLWLCGVARLDFFPQSFSRLSCICLYQSSGARRILKIVSVTSF